MHTFRQLCKGLPACQAAWRIRGMPQWRVHTQPDRTRKTASVSRASDDATSSLNEQGNILHCSPQQIASIQAAPGVRDGSANSIFSAVTVLMVLVYSLMLFATRIRMTRRIIHSPVLLGTLASTFALCAVASCQEGLLGALSSIVSKWCSSPSWVPDFALLAPLFNNPYITLMVWVHLLTLDFYVAREVFRDASIHSIPAAHSLVLCFFVGPIGLLCHALTRTLVFNLRKR